MLSSFLAHGRRCFWWWCSPVGLRLSIRIGVARWQRWDSTQSAQSPRKWSRWRMWWRPHARHLSLSALLFIEGLFVSIVYFLYKVFYESCYMYVQRKDPCLLKHFRASLAEARRGWMMWCRRQACMPIRRRRRAFFMRLIANFVCRLM